MTENTTQPEAEPEAVVETAPGVFTYGGHAYGNRAAAHIAKLSAENAKANETPYDPDAVDFCAVETSPGNWQLPGVPGAEGSWRSATDAKHAAQKAEAGARRAWANTQNVHSARSKSPGQLALEEHNAALAAFIEDGGAEEQAVMFPHLLDAYKPDKRTGKELYAEYKRNNPDRSVSLHD